MRRLVCATALAALALSGATATAQGPAATSTPPRDTRADRWFETLEKKIDDLEWRARTADSR